MSTFSWKELLIQWNQELLADEEIPAELPPEVITSGWLGYPGATAEQLAQLEARLGATLPPSYRDFLKFTNGWRAAGYFIETFWSTGEIEWYANRHQDLIDAWLEGEKYPGGITPTVSDEEYFAYDEDGRATGWLRSAYLQTTLEVGEGDGVCLLNPQVITPEGEWEAWFFAAWIPGAYRYRSFWDLMRNERKQYLQLRDSK